MTPRRRAVVTLAAAATVDLVSAVAFAAVERIPVATAVYWSVATATTVGYGDITPHHPAGRLLAVMVMLTVIPLFAATFSLLTSAVTTTHLRRLHEPRWGRLERRLDHIIRENPDIPPLPDGD